MVQDNGNIFMLRTGKRMKQPEGETDYVRMAIDFVILYIILSFVVMFTCGELDALINKFTSALFLS